MAEEELDALVVRAPDNVSPANFWGMKGYDAWCSPRGEPRAHEPPTPTRQAAASRRGDGARDRAGLLLGGRRRAARRGQLPDHDRRRARSSAPSRRRRRLEADDPAELIWTGSLNDWPSASAAPRPGGRPLRHDAPRRRADRRRRPRPGAEARDRAAARRARDRPDRGGLPARLGRRLGGGQLIAGGGPRRRDLGLLARGAGRPRGARSSSASAAR